MSLDALSWAFKNDVRPSAKKFLLVALADYASDTCACYPSVQTLRAKTGMNEKTIWKYLGELEEEGWITDTEKRVGVTKQIKVFRLNLSKNGSLPNMEATNFDTKGPQIYRERSPKMGDRTVSNLSGNQSDVLPPRKSKPTMDEVKEYCRSIGLPESDGEWFFHKCEGCGWVNANAPIKNWKSTIQAWRLGHYLPSVKAARSGGVAIASTQSGIDKSILKSEFDRIAQRLQTIRNQYDAHQSWSREDAEESRRLKTRRDELKKLLGVEV